MMLSNDAKRYLKEVWEYSRIEAVDAATAHCILENHLDQPEGEWPLDTEIWNAYADAFRIPRGIELEDFKQTYWLNDNPIHMDDGEGGTYCGLSNVPYLENLLTRTNDDVTCLDCRLELSDGS